ncbi:F-box only protein 31 [Umbelopsis sp. WA50703]
MTLVFSHLPTEILITILLYLDDASIAAVSACNRHLSEICSSEILWKRLCSPFGIMVNETSYRTIYQKLLTEYAWLLGVWQSDYTFYGGLLLVTLDRKSISIRGSLIQAQEHQPEPLNTWSLDPGVVIVNPKINLKGHDFFRIDLKGGSPCVSIPSETFRQEDINVISCDFIEHDLCPYLWQSVRESPGKKSNESYRIEKPNSIRYMSKQKAFTFVFNQAEAQSPNAISKVAHTNVHYSATRLFSWMSNANARLDNSPRFVKLDTSITRMRDPVKLADFNTSIHKQLPHQNKHHASKEFPEGLFKCYYGSHGLEYLIVRYVQPY